MLPTKFGVNWPFASGGKPKNKFSRWQPCWPSWIYDQNDLSYFDLLDTPMLPIKFQDNWPFVSGEVAKNAQIYKEILLMPRSNRPLQLSSHPYQSIYRVMRF